MATQPIDYGRPERRTRPFLPSWPVRIGLLIALAALAFEFFIANRPALPPWPGGPVPRARWSPVISVPTTNPTSSPAGTIEESPFLVQKTSDLEPAFFSAPTTQPVENRPLSGGDLSRFFVIQGIDGPTPGYFSVPSTQPVESWPAGSTR